MNITIDTIMADKNKYETLVHVITELYPSMTDYQKEKLEGVCPELKESEDEKIRKAIIEFLLRLIGRNNNNFDDSEIESWIAWLEKQKTINEPSVIEFDSSHSNIITLPRCKNDKHAQIRQWLFDLVSSFIWHKDWAVGKADCLAWIACQQKPVEWSEEDTAKMSALSRWLCSNNNSKFDGFRAFELVDWLKTLKPQNHWKPTDAQMECLLCEVNAWTKGCIKRGILESLYNELKKL